MQFKLAENPNFDNNRNVTWLQQQDDNYYAQLARYQLWTARHQW